MSNTNIYLRFARNANNQIGRILWLKKAFPEKPRPSCKN